MTELEAAAFREANASLLRVWRGTEGWRILQELGDMTEAGVTGGPDVSITAGELQSLVRATTEAMGKLGSQVSDRDMRLACLRVAADVAKIGLAHDVYATADRYYRFAAGQPVDDPVAAMTFDERMQALIDEFLRRTEGDGRLLKASLVRFHEYLDTRYPDLPAADVGGNVGVDYLASLDPANRVPR